MELSLFEKYNRANELTTKIVKKQERGELLLEFLEQINISRLNTKYKPVSIAKLALDVSHIPTPDLYYLLSICKDAGRRSKRYDQGFAKCFYYSIKVKNDKPI